MAILQSREGGKMKKIIAVAAAGALVVVLAGCSGTETTTTSQKPAEGQQAAQEEPKAEPLNLDGTWKSIDNESEDAWQEAVITGNTITIDWVSNNGETKALYWAGTVDEPSGETVDDTFTWDSVNDTEQTSTALLASGDATKKFTYSDGQISYEASAMGTTKTVRLERVN